MSSTTFGGCDVGDGDPYTIAVQSSTAIYGVNLALGASCLYLLKSATPLRKDRRTKAVVLVLYVSGMLGFASQAIVHVTQMKLGEVGAFFAWPHSPPGTTIWGGSQSSPMSLPFVILGADMFMVYTLKLAHGRH